MKATIRHLTALAAVVLGLGVTGAGCLTRPVAPGTPVTKTDVTIPVPNQAVDKIDMLFDIDNSASMGDKQAYLAQAIPLLIQRLVQPNCIDNASPPKVVGMVDNNGLCATGKAEFPPVHDMHIGVVTSSLGTRLSDQGVKNGAITPTATGYVLCDPNAVTKEYPSLNAHNDDRGELITRSETNGVDGTVGDSSPNGYLYYFPRGTPAGPQPPVTSPTTLETDFGNLVTGAGIYGCGIESQLESWYRFLVQPDPYDHLELQKGSDGNYRGGWNGVDTTIIQQRHDFLRPDSLVVVVVLTDENDSEIDVRSLQGTGYLFMHEDFNPPHGTSACAQKPDDPSCFNCPPSGSSDPACNPSTYTASNDWGFDANLRHVHMLQKYGVDPQYPIGRYYLGLQSTVVPDRTAEYPVDSKGIPSGSYQGCLPSKNDPNSCIPNCTNPLFAASLPDKNTPQSQWCNLPVGQRSNQKSNIFYAHIGGVPNQLLHFDPTDLSKSQLNDQDWVRILGQGAANYQVGGMTPLTHNYTGIDPHMIESYQDRTMDPAYGNADKSVTDLKPAASAPAAADPVSGREWVTDQPAPTNMLDAQMLPIGHVLPVDRQYACIFPLAQPRDCTQAANANSCDCPSDATGLSPSQIPPLCNPSNPTQQIAAKAYPTIRELTLAHLMPLGQGIVASLCPIDPTPAKGLTASTDPNYGYNPAVAVIVDRLKSALNNQCLPQKLQTTGDAGSAVPCLVLVSMPPSNGGTCTNPKCDNTKGLFGPGQNTGSAGNPPLEQQVLDKFCDTLEQNYVTGGGQPGAPGDPALQSACMMYQLTSADPNGAAELNGGSCSSYIPPGNNMQAGNGGGWCYVTGANAGGCAQGVQFSQNNPPAGSTTYLQCIEESISVVNASSGSTM